MIEREIVKNIPRKPGVYLFKDNKGTPIYIGKAKNLKNRVSSYFNKSNYIGNEKTLSLLEEATNLDYIVTSNESQAFILEANFIYTHKPKYNIMLKDTRVYPYILVTDEKYPKIKYVRTKKEEKGKYFGPYPDVRFVKDVIEVLQSVYKIRSCDRDLTRKSKPCFLYHLGRCYGPCYNDVDENLYNESVNKVLAFLAGDLSEVKNYLEKMMKEYAQIKNYEKAAQMRDTLFKLKSLFDEIAVEYKNGKNIDIIMYESPVYVVLRVRKGYLISKLSFTLEGNLEDFLYQYYIVRKNEPPTTIYTLYEEKVSEEITNYLKEQGLKKIEKIGKGSKLYEIGFKNLEEEINRQSDLSSSLKLAKEILSLKKLPRIIEGIDISHLQGLYTVASLVYFEDGRPKKENYRKYRLDNIKEPDDFESIRTVIRRRYQKNSLPDLLFIDGGKGQVNSAVEALKDIGYTLNDVDVIGIAKEDERIVFPGEIQDLHLPLDHPVLRLLIYVRDETHRFAIGFNRNLRSKRFERTKLDEIPGVGPKRKKELIQHFGGIRKIREASTQDIAKVVKSQKIAERIKQTLGEN
ncbi:excinuclease ABC subunit UvrC [Petrotoga sp. 9PWA.NaAc.5.4]|uniref:excinuclease ABC subunit UvrC n=1 Tax=Petrotoga sp. 9PWA.NaAc.5.4 TaxID=1434328 RepID=UPI000CC0520B|nr:excinuclease ABC subunit UvrC [Petrotoga sp. 9PWA.NaAc.5.4]PNR96290.1 excinuclease ABC subunit C [Petrotoga sp. 9PWA.NaAc.5.4]